jgi:hypothetical protein
MFKHVLIAVTVTGLMAVVPVEASAAKADAAGQMTCKDAAKVEFPNDRKMRKAFKLECKSAYKGRTTAS